MIKNVIILFFLLPFFGVCQNKELDSLWKEYNNLKNIDTIRLNAIHSIAWSYRANKPDTSIILATKELKFAEEKKLNVFKAHAIVTIGIAYKNMSNYTLAIDNFLEALKLFENAHNKNGEAMCYNNIGNVYRNQANYPKSLQNY